MVLLQNEQKKNIIKKRPSDDRQKYEQKNYVFAFFVLKNPQSKMLLQLVLAKVI